MTISGPVKLIAVAVGSITEASPAMKTSVDTHRRVDRTSWRTGCEDANRLKAPTWSERDQHEEEVACIPRPGDLQHWVCL